MTRVHAGAMAPCRQSSAQLAEKPFFSFIGAVISSVSSGHRGTLDLLRLMVFAYDDAASAARLPWSETKLDVKPLPPAYAAPAIAPPLMPSPAT